MSQIPMPEISDDFTVDDIHKIREWNYEHRKNMTDDEITADTKLGADAMLERIQRLRNRVDIAA